MRLGCLLLPLALLAAWRLRRRPVPVEDDDVEWSAYDPWLDKSGRVWPVR